MMKYFIKNQFLQIQSLIYFAFYSRWHYLQCVLLDSTVAQTVYFFDTALSTDAQVAMPSSGLQRVDDD